MARGFLSRYVAQVCKQILKGDAGILRTLAFYSKWKASLQPGRNSISDEQPWITFPVIDLLHKRTTKNSKVFEFGGGGSTLFFVNRAQEVVTVEHDREWFETLKNIITTKNTGNWSGNLVLPENAGNTASLNPSTPKDFFTKDPAFADYIFKAYATFIDRYPDEYFDIVLVDGRARPSCAWQSFSKIKKGGYLVIDNSDRGYYFSEIQNTLDTSFELVYNKNDLSPYVDFFTRTGVWKKL